MRSRNDRLHTGRLVGWSSAAVLVAGSIGFTGPAFAAQPETPSAHAAQGQAQGQAHQQAAQQQHDAAKAHGDSRPTRSHGSSAAGHQGGSAVSLAKPNHFQAQADPDGMENGGVDQPGGTGGVDTTTQDGNNGSGNDVDCEDDNRGVGVPGHCKDRPAADTPAGDEVPPAQGDLPDTLPGTLPGDALVPALVPGLGDSVAGQLLQASQVSTLADAPVADSVQVSAPTPQTVQVRAQAAHAGPATGVLPNTGASQALLGLSIAALAALAVGGGLVRQGRRTARVIS